MKLFEIKERPTATKEKTKLGDEFLNAPDFNAPEKAKQTKGISKLKQAGKEKTAKRVSGISLPDEAHEKILALANAGIHDKFTDDEAAILAGHHAEEKAAQRSEPKTMLQEPVTPENLPAVINKGVAERSPVEPDWHMVKHLPGYLKNPIRAMGRQVFGVFTNTDLEDIQILANVNDQGPNSDLEINAVANYLRNQGHEVTDAQMDFNQTIPGYKADVKMFTAGGYSFLLVKDFAGKYIYGWPSADDKMHSGSGREHLTQDRQRLK